MTPLQLEQLEILRDHVAVGNMNDAAESAATLIRLHFNQAIPLDVSALDKLILHDVDEQDTDCSETLHHSTSRCRLCGGL
jgi:hypothetical protein